MKSFKSVIDKFPPEVKDGVIELYDFLREEFEKLKEAIERLTFAQKKIQERLNQLAQRVDQLAIAQKKTEIEINSLTIVVKWLQKELGGISHSVGFDLENRGYKALPPLLIWN